MPVSRVWRSTGPPAYPPRAPLRAACARARHALRRASVVVLVPIEGSGGGSVGVDGEAVRDAVEELALADLGRGGRAEGGAAAVVVQQS